MNHLVVGQEEKVIFDTELFLKYTDFSSHRLLFLHFFLKVKYYYFVICCYTTKYKISGQVVSGLFFLAWKLLLVFQNKCIRSSPQEASLVTCSGLEVFYENNKLYDEF